MEISHLALFVATSLLLILTPGPDLMLVMSRSIAKGQRAGLATAAGVSTGLLGHTLLAALGLGAVLQSSILLFTALKLIGAAYLIYLGWHSLRAPHASLTTHLQKPVSARQLFLQGAIANVSNPKIAIFYFAFLPQFVAPDSAHPTLAMLLLGLIFAVLTLLIKSPIAMGAARLSAWLRDNPRVETWMNRASGVVLLGLGARLAFEKR